MITNKRVAFITGANRGIGLETTRELGQKGIAVVLGARDYNNGQVAARELKRSGIDADALEFDMLKNEHHRSVYRYFEERYGRLDFGAGKNQHNKHYVDRPATQDLRRQFLRCLRAHPNSAPVDPSGSVGPYSKRLEHTGFPHIAGRPDLERGRLQILCLWSLENGNQRIHHLSG